MEKVCLIRVESYVIHCDYSAQPLVDILSGGFNQEVEWKTPNLDPKWDMHERDSLSDQALLPPAKHQVVFIEAPRAIVLYPRPLSCTHRSWLSSLNRNRSKPSPMSTILISLPNFHIVLNKFLATRRLISLVVRK